mgnify:CR=1 FL=1
MKHSSLFLGCCISLCILSGCNNDSSIVFDGCSLTSKPELPIIQPNNEKTGIWMDACSGVTTSNQFLDFNHKDTITLTGWAIDQNNNTNLENIILKVGSSYIKANYGISRNDVKDALGCDNGNVGFSFSFSKNLLQDQSGFIVDHIELFQITKNAQCYEPIRYDLIKEPEIPTNKPVHERSEEITNGGIYIDSYSNGSRDSLYIKEIENKGMITISGWAIDTEVKSRLFDIFLKIGSHVLSAQTTERPDVQEAYGIDDSMLGMTFEIPTYMFKNENGEYINQLEIISVDKSNQFLYTPKVYYLVYE